MKKIYSFFFFGGGVALKREYSTNRQIIKEKQILLISLREENAFENAVTGIKCRKFMSLCPEY